MSVTLRWPAERWHKAPIMCRLFGHVYHSGWWGYRPYLRPRWLPGYQDGIGTRHVDLTCECSRCGQKHVIAHIHNWERNIP